MRAGLLERFCIFLLGYLLCTSLLFYSHLLQLYIDEKSLAHKKSHGHFDNFRRPIRERKFTIGFSGKPGEVQVVDNGGRVAPSFVLLEQRSPDVFTYGIALTRAPEEPIQILLVHNDCYVNVTKRSIRIAKDNSWASTRVVSVHKRISGSCAASPLAHIVRTSSAEPLEENINALAQPSMLISQASDEFVVLVRFGRRNVASTTVPASAAVQARPSAADSISLNKSVEASVTTAVNRSREEDERDGWYADETVEFEGIKWYAEPKFSLFMRGYGCTRLKRGRAHSVLQCALAHQTKFYIIGNLKKPVDKTVFILGGVHGTERAGMLAASHIRKNWHPSHGVLVVLPIANVCGAHRHSRYFSCGGMRRLNQTQSQGRPDDLNRNFPIQGEPITSLGQSIWELMTTLQPSLFMDLHEGWGFYAQLKDNAHDRLVGSNNFSKGSSVIASPNALGLANRLVNEINKNIGAKSRKFLVSSPPIEGGLALKLYKEYGSAALVLETTIKGQPLELRASQHLLLVSKALKQFDMLPKNFKPDKLSQHTAAQFVNMLSTIGHYKHHSKPVKVIKRR